MLCTYVIFGNHEVSFLHGLCENAAIWRTAFCIQNHLQDDHSLGSYSSFSQTKNFLHRRKILIDLHNKRTSPLVIRAELVVARLLLQWDVYIAENDLKHCSLSELTFKYRMSFNGSYSKIQATTFVINIPSTNQKELY